MKQRTIYLINIAAMLGLLIVVAVTVFFPQPYEYQGSLIEPPADSYAFALTKEDGTTYRLQDQQGKVVLIFFGYANCPDVCPTTLSDFKKIQGQLADQADQVEFVFITIDPERDTPQDIENYVSAFDPSFVGLSGSVEELQSVWDGYFVYRAKVESGSEAGYLMDHTARVYVIDQQGNLRLTFPFGMEADAMAADIAQLVDQN
ncbi:MAG: SCO family protein [Chloroflexi bacterium]|nr:MAG: SCO family protein [Chloroflexota bacterium]MBL1197385.1 SCO family protein [Chloroflexota bacterium]NOH14681.1 SCO family protein [Chloroflexota bacterium]